MSNRSQKNSQINWYTWCNEAFQKAISQNKAIFISIGYPTCQLCNKMEKKVFQNQECIDILNKDFICIKVDKDERADIDKYYQKVHYLLNNRIGGWPTSIFCTPQNKPFFAGTYIPLESLAGSIEGMGFIELTKLIGSKVRTNDTEILKNADEVESFLNNKKHPTQATVLKEDFTKNFLYQAKSNYQTRYGGFSVSPKFPHANTLATLITIDKLHKDKSARAMVQNTLTNMRKGGMYDLVDGGFFRYSTDDTYLVPHFEKMLYDNALLCELYTQSYLAYKDINDLYIAKNIADFWYNIMSEDNLFYSASGCEDGEYFTFCYKEVKQILEDAKYKDIKNMLEQMSITKEGNFNGKNIIRFEDKIPPYFKDIRILLQNLRKNKTYPNVDKKIQTSHSAMMIKSLFILGEIDTKYKQIAIKTLDTLLKTMDIDNTLYHSTYIHKKPNTKAFLEDYAFLSSALIEGYKQTKNDLYLITAQKYTNKALIDFYNNAQWLFSYEEFETIADITDNVYTSCCATMVDVLLSLSKILKDEKYNHFAFKTLEYNSYELARKPIYSPCMLRQVLEYLKII
jgi:uncharacterized protein YyaL (SSP411 family)